ncbi:MAG: DUF294 nucleotidyltransferase-like domain-containing protein [Vulcanibacillus sp.]
MTKHQDNPEPINYSAILKGIQPFSYLTSDSLEQLVPKIERKVFPVNSFVFRQGEESKRILFIIISGLAEISVRNDNGDNFVLDYRDKGSFFGETVVLSDKAYVATIRCLTDIDCLLIRSKDIEILLENNGVFSNYFNKMVADHFYDLINKIPKEHGIMKGLISFENHAANKRASELMNHPVITCSSTEKINNIALIMSKEHVSSIVLVDNRGEICGTVTEKDFVEKLIAKNLSPNNFTAGDIANKNPLCISPDSFYYQILLAMTKEKVKHAIVTEANIPIGIITIRDLIRSRNTGVISVIDRLETQSNLKNLATVGQEIEQVLNGLIMENAPIPEILDIITEFYDRLTRQVIDLSIEEMLPEFGPPPVKFCWLTMGSGGRREQFLRTDQDNAIIYETVTDLSQTDKVAEYFTHLSNLINNGLETCGFALCPGNVMASNPLWRGDRSYWNKKVSTWVFTPEKKNIRLLTIFLDFRPVYGYYPLAEELRSFTNKCFASFPLALSHLAQDACRGKLPLNIFGNFVGENSREHKNEIDIKTSISVFLVDSLRILALSKNTTSTNSLERLQYLRQTNTLSKDLSVSLEIAFQTIMRFRISANLEKLKSGKPLDNYINLSTMDQIEKNQLKDALKAIENLVATVKEEFIRV